MSDPSKLSTPLVPLAFGIVGHRDPRPEDDQALREALRTIFRGFRAAYPRTPQLLLSALAAGADQIAVEVALECGAAVRAPLPFPPEIYAKTTSFDSADSTAATQMLRWVRDGAVEAFVEPLPSRHPASTPVDWAALANDSQQRRICYANAGGYIVRHCDVLIAMWDEDTDPRDLNKQRKLSGTAEFVALKLDGTAPALYPWSLPLGFRADRGPVCVIHTPRVGQKAPAESVVVTARLPGERQIRPASILWRRTSPGARFTGRVLSWVGLAGSHGAHAEHPHAEMVSPAGKGPNAAVDLPSPETHQFRAACVTVDEFNADVDAHFAANPRTSLDATWKTLFPPEEPIDGMKPALQRVAQLRDIAGTMARRLDARMDRWQFLLFASVIVAVLSFHSYSERFFGHPPWMLWLFIGALFAAFVIVGVVWWQRLDERRLDYRALAEALRVRCFWSLAGLEDSVADSYLGQLRGEMAWARRAIRSICPPSHVWREDFDQLPAAEQKERIETVRVNWAVEQQKFYERKGHANHSKARLYRGFGTSLALLGWVLAMALLFIRESASEGTATLPGEGTRHEAVTYLSGFFVVIGGFALVICERRFHEELSKQYERMAVVFADANRELQSACETGDLTRARRTIRALGQEAIAEHAQWLILRRARPFELHIA